MKKTFFLALALFGFILAGCIGNTQANLNAASPSGEAAVPIPATKNTIFAMDEIAKHDQAGNCWMVINGKVLDLSDFSSHPGGSAYLPYCGKDATLAFYSKGNKGEPHSDYASSLLPDYQIGTLKP